MSPTTLTCGATQRLAILRDKNKSSPVWNGIDYVELESNTVRALLRVEFLCAAPYDLKESEFKLVSKELNQTVRVQPILPVSGSTIFLEAERPLCERASYTLTFFRPGHVDPQFASYRFTAVGDGDIDVDPKPPDECPPPARPDPQLNYLARDYGSFRQLLLDRMALSMPDWRERHVPDCGHALVELFAYVGDYLAWYQDAVATEAYLNTARQRISVRRHARLVDYQLHEGCNARTFLHIAVEGDVNLETDDIYFVTKVPDDRLEKQPVLDVAALDDFPPQSFQAFEIVQLAPGCRPISRDDIKNPTGLIAWLCDGKGKLEEFLMSCSEADDVQAIVEYAVAANAPPAAALIDCLAAALNMIVQQYRLAEHIDFSGLVSPDVLQQIGCKVHPCRTVETNVSLLCHALEQFLAKPAKPSLPLYRQHNEIYFYTWNQSECCLPAGATKAMLRDCAPGTCGCTANGPPYSAFELAVDPFAVEAVRQSDVAARQPSNTPVAPPVEAARSRPYEEPASLCSPFVQAHRQKWNLGHLSPGDLLLFEERLGPKTHNPADADPAHRQVVRLTRVTFCIDPVTEERLVEIEWATDDALRFPLCISSVGPAEAGCRISDSVSVARGNIVFVDHGRRIDQPEWLGSVAQAGSNPTCRHTFCDDFASPDLARAGLFRPILKESDLTFAPPVADCNSATQMLVQKPHTAVPAVKVFAFPVADVPSDAVNDPSVAPRTIINEDDLRDGAGLIERLPKLSDVELRRLEVLLPAKTARLLLLSARGNKTKAGTRIGPSMPEPGTQSADSGFHGDIKAAVTWESRMSLLDSRPEDRHFVVEIDNERCTHLRFGDGDLGRLPPAETSFYASYRRGNGLSGNVGADTITHLVYRRSRPNGGITSVRNPLPAVGGVEPESLDHARQHAPYAFRKLRRCITADDYAEIARRDFPGRVQQARATLNGMGTWYEVAVAIDPQATVRNPSALVDEVRRRLEQYRRINHLLRVELPIYVGLHIEMTVCVTAGYLRAHVQRELLAAFSNQVLADGTRGFFHPDNFSFGDALYLSKLVAAARKVSGVENVDVTRFERLGQNDRGERESGVMNFAPLEIPRLDNDPLRPDNGCFCLNMQGAR